MGFPVHKVNKAREAVTVLRDAVRDGKTIDFRKRDQLVIAIHSALDDLEGRLEAETKTADLHRELNKGVAEALGLRLDESWHDLPERVARLVALYHMTQQALNSALQVFEALGKLMPALPVQLPRSLSLDDGRMISEIASGKVKEEK